MRINEDIWNVDERIDFPDENEYNCFGCGWCGVEPYIVREYGMEFFLCPECWLELVS